MELFEQALVEKYLYLAFCDFSGELKRARGIRTVRKSTALRMETFKTFRPRGVYILRGLSSHQSGRPLNLNIPCAGVF